MLRINYLFCVFFVLQLLHSARSDSSLSSESSYDSFEYSTVNSDSSEGAPPSPNWKSPSLIEVSADGSDQDPNSQASQFNKDNEAYSPAALKHERKVEEEDEISDISIAILGPQIEAPPTAGGPGGSGGSGKSDETVGSKMITDEDDLFAGDPSSKEPIDFGGEVPQETQVGTAYSYDTIKNLWLNSINEDCGWFTLGLTDNCLLDYFVIGPVKFLDNAFNFVETLI